MLSGVEASIMLSSCEKIKNPYLPATTTGGDTADIKVRKLLMEEFTGHKCGTCPPGAQTINTLIGQHGEKMIAVAIHAGFYATVGTAPYTADFQCNEGDDYYNFFGVSVNPIGMVNRRNYPNSHLKNVSEWGGVIDTVLAVAPDADLKITNTYNSSTRVLNSSVRCEFLKPLNGTYKIVLLLTEDSIVAPQKDYNATPQDVLNYVHRHMLRDGITTSWGDPLVSGTIAAGDTVVKTFNYTLPANFNGIVPDENHCHVVAYIYDADPLSPAYYEVMQAEEEKIK